MKIKSRDFLFGVTVLLQGSNLLVNILLQGLSWETWISFAAAVVIGIPLVIFYLRQGNLHDFFINSFGEKIGKIVLWLYVVFFAVLAAYNINLLASFVEGYVLEETPKVAFIIIFAAVCAYGAKGGGINLLKIAGMFFTVSLITDAVNTFLLWDKVESKNLLPIFDHAPLQYLKSIFLGLMFLLSDIIIFTIFLKKDDKNTNLLWGYVIGSTLLFFVILRSIATLGVVTSVSVWPTHEALRLINSKNTMARIETSSVFVMLAMVFFKVSVIYAGAVEEIKKLTSIKKQLAPTLILGVLIFITSCVIFKSGAISMEWGGQYGWVIILPFSLVFPVIGAIFKIKNKKM